ncbi:UvrB/UvrC motif-containing protein [Candidatus Venteria ishoeyi]|uniref:UvrABC system protein C n=1 Tax=Candidatus Venteria ishoeyi TaxID=1899563 RepID=A0A1H6F4N2_9GAMM|nr:UvrB/UvrC motif-containing protein [Candidatus Venteria ishoeyi]SEH05090.1 UvrABC system protein C [Candidatus Venteria ishoeyi]
MLQEIYPVIFHNIYKINNYPKKLDYHSPIEHLPEITSEKYLESVNDFMDFFEGKTDFSLQKLQEKMMTYAKNQQFESAKMIRDFLQKYQKVLETQIISEIRDIYQDVFGYCIKKEKTYVCIFQIRTGKII